MYQNEITDASLITVSSLLYGTIGGVFAEQLGSATVQNGGVYSGNIDRQFVVEIDSVAGGKEVGQATFKWSDTGGVTWNETGVLTQTDPYLMSYGVTVKFTTGSGDDFELEDRWSWICSNNYGTQKLIDLDREYWYQSRSLDNPNTITVDLGSAKNIKACEIFDHNFSSVAVITLMANDADSWGSPSYSRVLTWNDEKIGVYLDETYRYWRLQVSNQTNPDGYIRVGELYLGSYMELSRNFELGRGQKTVASESSQRSKAGIERRELNYLQEVFGITFKDLVENDITLLLAMFKQLKSVSQRKSLPFFFNVDCENPNDTFLVHIEKELDRSNIRQYLDLYDVSMTLTEVSKSSA
ncbi:MAG: hypothetical protein AB1401_00530 [Thermodesulfobacteriota bacterium]